VDPCGRLYCDRCPAVDCTIRQAPKSLGTAFVLEEAIAEGPA
jgi:hypothetical protein